MKKELLFCPLGGAGEIGANMNLYGYGNPFMSHKEQPNPNKKITFK